MNFHASIRILSPPSFDYFARSLTLFLTMAAGESMVNRPWDAAMVAEVWGVFGTLAHPHLQGRSLTLDRFFDSAQKRIQKFFTYRI